jgi:AraC family transcriptional regulator of arabinose operon
MCEGVDLTYYYHGIQACHPGYSWGPGVKDHYKILFIHEGKGTYAINGRTYPLEQGQGFMVFPNILCHMKADEQQPWVYSWIAFQGESVADLLSEVDLSKEKPTFHYQPATWYEEWLDQFDNALNSGSAQHLVVHSLLYRLIAEWMLLVTSPRLKPSAPRPKELYVRKALEYIKANYYDKISISELARTIGIDRIYLSSLFKEATQQSPQAYLLEYRMERACELMKDPRLSITEISHSVGYNDPLLFSKMFKKVKGSSPSHYRASHQAS